MHTRERVHVQRTWSEDGGRIEATKDNEDRWVKLPTETMVALRAHCEAIDLEASMKDWSAEQRRLVFPNKRGRITRYGQLLELVWQDLLGETRLRLSQRESRRGRPVARGAQARDARKSLPFPRSSCAPSDASRIVDPRPLQAARSRSYAASRGVWPPAGISRLLLSSATARKLSESWETLAETAMIYGTALSESRGQDRLSSATPNDGRGAGRLIR